MKLKKLELINFRNYEYLNICFNRTKSLIVGKNAQGKTNILEAIYFISSLCSNRAKTDSELIYWNKDCASIKLTYIKDDFETQLFVSIPNKKKKILKIDGVKKNKSSDFISNLKVVSFNTDDLLLLRGTPENRRNWLDLAINQIYPSYIDRISKYNKIKNQKNNLLKLSKTSGKMDHALLSVYNNQLVVTGANILFLRLKFINELINYAKINHKKIAITENLSIVYNSNIIGDVNFEIENTLITPEEIAVYYEQKLEEIKSKEILRGQMLIGPHIDDLSFFINNVDSKKYASQGQQRTIVLALKLSELQIIQEKCNVTPILLLDDVLAELDDIRQSFLIENLNTNNHTIMTSVDAFQFDNKYLKDVETFKISNGTIIE